MGFREAWGGGGEWKQESFWKQKHSSSGRKLTVGLSADSYPSWPGLWGWRLGELMYWAPAVEWMPLSGLSQALNRISFFSLPRGQRLRPFGREHQPEDTQDLQQRSLLKQPIWTSTLIWHHGFVFCFLISLTLIIQHLRGRNASLGKNILSCNRSLSDMYLHVPKFRKWWTQPLAECLLNIPPSYKGDTILCHPSLPPGAHLFFSLFSYLSFPFSSYSTTSSLSSLLFYFSLHHVFLSPLWHPKCALSS